MELYKQKDFTRVDLHGFMGRGSIAAVIVVLLIGVMVGGAIVWMEPSSPIPVEEFDSNPTQNPPGSQTILRNCIKSVLGNDPDCSNNLQDSMRTTCNGRELGELTYEEARIDCR
jgi:hypothetical protein